MHRVDIASRGLAAALLAGIVGMGTVGAASAADFTMKFATIPQNEPTHEYMKRYEACIEPASDNRIDVEIYTSAQLGGLSRMQEGLQLGTIEAAMMAGQHMKGVEARYGVVDAPGLFNSIEHANAAYWDPSFRDRYLAVGKDKGVMGIGIFAYGPVSFQTKEPITTLEDFEGQKIRILATEVERKLADALGATGLQVDFPEIVPSLQRGQIDGAHASIVIANAAKFYTVAEHVTLTNEAMIAVVPFLSTKFFDKLPEDLQSAVLECGKSVEREMEAVAIEFDTASLERWKSNGGQVHTLSQGDQAKLFERAVAIGEEVIGGDPELKPLYDALVAASKKHAG